MSHRAYQIRPIPGFLAVGLALCQVVAATTYTYAQPKTRTAEQQKAIDEVEGNAKTIPNDTEQLRRFQKRLQDLAKRVIPCTVNIQVGPAQGSGVIISEDGYVLTAAHVGGKPNRDVTMVFPDGKRVRGRTLGLYRTLDAGLMKITDEGKWPHVKLGTSADLKKGQWCIATGHPGGLEPNRPPVFRLGRILNVNKDVIVSDCTLVGGDSGGPLFDLNGKVIGINSRIGPSLTANMHVPVATYEETWDRLVAGDAWGNLPGVKPYIGVQGDTKTDEARVAIVYPGTPADKAGIEAGDVILKFDTQEVDSFSRLVELVREKQPGESVRLLVKRGDKELNLTLKIGKRND